MKITNYTEWLFYHIWKKNSTTETSCPCVIIPDTVIFRWAQPFFWYFTNEQGVLRKQKDKIDIKRIIKVMNEEKLPIDVVAVLNQLANSQRLADDGEIQPSILNREYLNKKQLGEFW